MLYWVPGESDCIIWEFEAQQNHWDYGTHIVAVFVVELDTIDVVRKIFRDDQCHAHAPCHECDHTRVSRAPCDALGA